MNRQVVDLLPFVVEMLAGLALGTICGWKFLRSRVDAAKAETKLENQTEVALLTERMTSLNSAVEREQSQRKEALASVEQLQSQLKLAQTENAQLGERANRISSLERELGSLRGRFEEESVRAAALTEQIARISQLEGSLDGALRENREHNRQMADLRERAVSSESMLQSEKDRTARLESELTQTVEKNDALIQERQKLSARIAELGTSLAAEKEQTPEKLSLLEKAQTQLSDTFKALANDILEDKVVRFTELNKTNIGSILDPLRVKLQEFQDKVEDVYVKDVSDRVDLKAQVRQLTELNQKVSQEANNLTQALKGSSKTQGNWGEFILENILEASGLRQQHEYELRETYRHDNGHRGQPDVVIHMPGAKHVVVDAKVSLKDYEQFVNATGEVDRGSALGRHVASVRRHIKELSEKDYPALLGLNSLDFVIMFVPIESAFANAIGEDPTLWETAWKKNVLLVSPSTLLFVLRTVVYLWRQEDQVQHVREIASRGADLYDKLVGFVDDLLKLGNRLEQATESYEGAVSKLCKGKRSVIGQAEQLKDLGITPSKSLPVVLVESAMEESLVLPLVAANEERPV